MHRVTRIALGLALIVAACEAAQPPPPPKTPEPIDEGPVTSYGSMPMASGLAPGSMGAGSASESAIASASVSASVAAIPTSGLVDLSPSRFGGTDVCLRDTGGDQNACAKMYGVSNGMGGIERPCQLEATVVTALVDARLAMKKVNPNLDLMIVSSYRPPEHQQCLWLDGSDGKKCLSTVCGARDAKGNPMKCKKYDLANPAFTHIFDHCKHVDMRAIDVCAYDKTKVTLDAKGVIDLTKVEDCRTTGIKSAKLKPGFFFHPCGCRRVDWTKDMREGSKRAKVIFQHGGVDEQQAMTKALRDAGFKDDVGNEWWHFHYPKP